MNRSLFKAEQWYVPRRSGSSLTKELQGKIVPARGPTDFGPLARNP